MPNSQRKFTPDVEQKLGEYVYALGDPRDGKIFYVGKGKNSRVFEHFSEAAQACELNGSWSSKLRRIVEIWEEDLDVNWWIVRYNIGQNNTAFDIESAIIDVLEVSQNGAALNQIAGHNKGILPANDVSALAATPVNPISACTVFIFPIANSLAHGNSAYSATRTGWNVSEKYRELKSVLAVGVANGISQGVFEIERWVPDANLWDFEGKDVTLDHQLSNKSWLSVLNAYFRYGNYLVVEFDGKGKFQYLRGSSVQCLQGL